MMLKQKFFIVPILILACSNWGCLSRSEAEITESANSEISRSEALQNLEKMCVNLPFFNKLNPSEKSLGRYGDTIFYRYQLKQDFDQLKATYKNKLLSEGWTVTREKTLLGDEIIEFQKNKLEIYISRSLRIDEDYAVSCQDKSLR